MVGMRRRCSSRRPRMTSGLTRSPRENSSTRPGNLSPLCFAPRCNGAFIIRPGLAAATLAVEAAEFSQPVKPRLVFVPLLKTRSGNAAIVVKMQHPASFLIPMLHAVEGDEPQLRHRGFALHPACEEQVVVTVDDNDRPTQLTLAMPRSERQRLWLAPEDSGIWQELPHLTEICCRWTVNDGTRERHHQRSLRWVLAYTGVCPHR